MWKELPKSCSLCSIDLNNLYEEVKKRGSTQNNWKPRDTALWEYFINLLHDNFRRYPVLSHNRMTTQSPHLFMSNPEHIIDSQPFLWASACLQGDGASITPKTYYLLDLVFQKVNAYGHFSCSSHSFTSTMIQWKISSERDCISKEQSYGTASIHFWQHKPKSK